MKLRLALVLLFVLSLGIVISSAEDVQIGEPFSVQIMGNANQDEVVNDLDIAKINEIISGKEKKNSLSDANNDGVIDQKDIDQIQKIIDGKEDTIYYVNLMGEIASVKHPLNKIIIVKDNTAEIIRILGSQDKVVGVDTDIIDLPMYFPELSKVQSIGNRKDCNVEKILELNPDAVFIHAVSEMGCPDLEQKLKDKGIDVVRLGTWQSHTAVPSLMLMAYMLDEVDNAQNYIAYQQKILNSIKERIDTIPAEKRLNVFIDRPGDTTVSKGSGYSEALEFAGGNNIGKKLSGGFESVLPAVDAEWVVKQNPDAIIGLSWEGGYETNDKNTVKKRYDEVVAKPGFSTTNAVKSNKVFITPYINVLGPGYHIGLIQFAKWLYPDLFADMSVQQAQNEYITNWQHTLYDLENNGIFGYPAN
ncbi:MAG TPA: ABC transporter substrate-binding protein [Methanospirillum sp.]|nr:ABC transporter substrate-binding protein [Methanospirillum sp.]